MTDLLEWEQDKSLYLFTSLTAGSTHVITATSRIDTILKAARIPFSYIDTATNESAKKLYQRRGKGKKLPLLVKEGFVIGDLGQVEEWNEFGELQEAIGPVATTATSHVTAPLKPGVPAAGAVATGSSYAGGASSGPAANTTPGSRSTGLEGPVAGNSLEPSVTDALRKAAFESATAAKDKKAVASGTAATAIPSSGGTRDTLSAVPSALSPDDKGPPPPPAPTPITEPNASLSKATPLSPVTETLAKSSLSKETSNVSDAPASSTSTIPATVAGAAGAGGAASISDAGDAAGSSSSALAPASSQQSLASARSSSSASTTTATTTTHQPALTMHRGASVVSTASEQEIKEIESQQAIPEESEKEQLEEAAHEREKSRDTLASASASASAPAAEQKKQDATLDTVQDSESGKAEPKSKMEAVKRVVAEEELSTKDKVVEAAKVVVGKDKESS